MVSTDGHRLSKVERTIPNGPKLSAGVIIPKKGVLELKKVLEQGSSSKGPTSSSRSRRRTCSWSRTTSRSRSS
jgi:DNA polymerase III sliding clamp (beta) subunit (PCNA family)